MVRNIIVQFDDLLFAVSPYENFCAPEKCGQIDALLLKIYETQKSLIKHRVFVKEIFKQELETLGKGDFTSEELGTIFSSITQANTDIINLLKIHPKNIDLYGIVKDMNGLTLLRIYFHKLNSLFKDYFVGIENGFLNSASPNVDPYKSIVIGRSEKVLSTAANLGFQIYEYLDQNKLTEYLISSLNFELPATRILAEHST